ncbi:MAG: ATP-binding protein [Alphaproteobacteria bacterium]
MTATETGRLGRRLARERQARKQAEALLEQKSRELYEANQELASAVGALEASTSRLSAILDHSFAGTLVSDQQNRIIVINRAARSMFRQNDADVIGMPMVDLFDGESRLLCADAATSFIGSIDEGGSEVWHQASGRRPDGAIFPLEFIVTDLRLSEDRHRVWIFRDLTQHHAAETERQVLADGLRQAQKLEALGTMAGGVAHEINTPVQYIGDNINYLRDGVGDLLSLLAAYRDLAARLDADSAAAAPLQQVRRLEVELDLDFLMDEIPEAIAQAGEGLARVSTIVQAVKQFAHPGSREGQAFDANQAIDSTIEVCRGQWKYIAELQTRFADDLPKLTGHQGEFNQIMLNLIVNAAEAIEESGRAGAGLIQVRTSLDQGGIVIEVGDNGCGVPAAIRDRIFEPFFTTKDVGKGTGQGLAFCFRAVTQSFDGRIEVASTEGQGSTFRLFFPVAANPADGQQQLAAV